MISLPDGEQKEVEETAEDEPAVQPVDGLEESGDTTHHQRTDLLCQACQLPCASSMEFQKHVKTPFHVLNLKLRAAGVLRPVSESELRESGELLDGVPAAGDDDDRVRVNAYVEQQVQLLEDEIAEAEQLADSSRKTRRRLPQVWFVSGGGEDNARTRWAVWSAVLERTDPLPSLRSLLSVDSAKFWFIGAVCGGRFAAAVFHGKDVLEHKSFSRYTVRQKQGGSQSSKDGQSATKQPRSVGASIRRREEIRLAEEVASILSKWRSLIDRCSRIFLACPGSNRYLLVARESASPATAASLFSKSDPRLRNIPFPLPLGGRPTFASICLAHQRLSTVYIEPFESDGMPGDVSDRTPSPVAPIDAAEPSSSIGPSAALANPLPGAGQRAELISRLKSQDEDGVLALLTKVLHDEPSNNESELEAIAPLQLCIEHRCKSAVAMLLRAIEEDEDTVGDCLLLGAAEPNFTSPLHQAIQNNDEKLALKLLELGSNPAQQDVRARVPADLSSKSMRLALRKFAGANPLACDDWKMARIEPLNSAQEAAQRARAREKKARANARKKERARAEKQAAAAAAEIEAVASMQKEKASQLTDRERRALAAEARILGTTGLGCASCGNRLPMIPFERLTYKYCSVTCVQIHKKKLG